MTEKWLPTLQKDFNVIPALACNGISQPYWETGFTYPLQNEPAHNSTSSSSTAMPASATHTGLSSSMSMVASASATTIDLAQSTASAL
jgi:hypothetical protein